MPDTCRSGEHLYTPGFYDGRRSGSRQSAEAMLPIVLDLIAPRSIVDLGCATGEWLAVAKRHGVREVLGIDLARVPDALMELAAGEFLAADLTEPLHVDRRFDLALVLEVAEHVPAEYADVLLDSVVRLSPAILFSAAIPHQGGTGHVNEQWQAHWRRRFDSRGYDAFDVVRARIWNNRQVWSHYAQNTFLYVSRAERASSAVLAALSEPQPLPVEVVHPAVYLSALKAAQRR